MSIHPLQLSPDEIDAARQVALCDHSHAALLEEATRLRAFLDANCRGLEDAVLLGIASLESTFLADLGRLPALDPGQVHAKARAFGRRPRVDDNLSAMLLASLEADAERLGLLAARRPCARCGRFA
jgi:hypothetical protein